MPVLPHIETSQLICTENQLTSFYMRATLALKGLISVGTNSELVRNRRTQGTGAVSNKHGTEGILR